MVLLVVVGLMVCSVSRLCRVGVPYSVSIVLEVQIHGFVVFTLEEDSTGLLWVGLSSKSSLEMVQVSWRMISSRS